MSPRLSLILQHLDRLPTLPTVAVRVLELAADDAADAGKVADVIRDDPALTTRILQLLTNSANGVREPVTDVRQAVALLGFEQVKAAVLVVSVFDCLSGAAKEQPDIPADADAALRPDVRRKAFWQHCLGVACCAERLAATAAGGVSPSEAFLAGMLHDMGKIALDAALPKSFQRVVEAVELTRGDIAELEQQIIGMDHHAVGKRLAENWKLPAAVRDVAWLHGTTGDALHGQTEHAALVQLVTLADRLVREQHIGYSGNHDFTTKRKQLMAAARLTEPQVETLANELVELVGPRAEALGLESDGNGDLYQRALLRANKELGHVSDQLAAKNRKLTTRARFFDALTDFHGRLAPDAPHQTVLSAIAATAPKILDCDTAAAFSIDPGYSTGEVLLLDRDGNTLQTSPLTVPEEMLGEGTPYPPLDDDAPPVQPIGDVLEWAVASISPRLSGPTRWWVPLIAEGQIVGGLLWGGGADEADRLAALSDEIRGLAHAWALALRTAQIRDEARDASEQLAETARRLQAAQDEALRAKTMAALGQVAAGAAHEMNNPLMVISGRSQLLFQQLKMRDPNNAAKAKLIFEQSQRLSEMISQLMEFAKPPKPHLQATSVGDLLKLAFASTQPLIEAGLWQKRTVETAINDVPAVTVDPQHIADAIAEVLANALQHTPDGGTVQVSAAFDVSSNRVMIGVTDNGAGMSDEVRQHACDPFFSAKPAGRRRGMGLAKALRRVDSVGGWLKIESRPDKGTRVMVLLPASDQPPVPVEPIAKSA